MKRFLKSVALGLGPAILIVLVIWRIVRHLRIPVQESELDLEFTSASPHVLDSWVFAGDLPPQFIHEGVGPLFHRRYYVDMANVAMSKEELMTKIIKTLNTFTAWEMAVFQKLTNTEEKGFKEGDDFRIHITGPWNGPVRVIDVTPTSFSFITLNHHLEAGEIQFRLIDHPDKPELMRFEIRSWSRSRDRIIDFFYNYVPFVRIGQTRMWVYFCQRVVEVGEGEATDEVHVMTHRVPWHQFRSGTPGDLHPWQQYYPHLQSLRHSSLNFELDKREELIESGGWYVDAYATDLPNEDPGLPEPGGVWEQAKEVLLNYEFPDPDLIKGIYMPDEPLSDRVMLLEAQYLGFTFYFGVRVSAVIDEVRTDPDLGEAQVWGYGYHTLQGHFERGEITFEVWKFIETGKVEFRVKSYSTTAEIRNPFYRIGFALLGRRLQQRFADTALERMQKLVIARLTGEDEDKIERPEIGTVTEETAADLQNSTQE